MGKKNVSGLKNQLTDTLNKKSVHGFNGSRFHSLTRTAFETRNYEKSVGFVRPNPRSEAHLAITWGK